MANRRHPNGPCKSADCHRPFCVGYRLGFEEGYQDGYAAGAASGDAA